MLKFAEQETDITTNRFMPPLNEECEQWDDRTVALIGPEAAERLRRAKVLVVGVGGVGGYAAEMLCRAGVGRLHLIDADQVAMTNLNRQIMATHDSLGELKAVVLAERFHSINPDARIETTCDYLQADAVAPLLDVGFDFVIDAIDSVGPKVALLAECIVRKQPVISSMGAGGRLDPSKVGYMDLWQTRDDGLAKAVRQGLKKAGLKDRRLHVVASTEPAEGLVLGDASRGKRTSRGTLATIPALFGIFLANFAIRKIIGR